MKLSSGYETKKARVEMLPLIDVVFLLLVFFIYAMVSMVYHRGMRLDLPAAASARPDAREHIAITLDADNRVLLDGTPVALDALPDRLRALRGDATRPVFIAGDRAAALGPALTILDILRQAGIEEVSFSCIPPTP